MIANNRRKWLKTPHTHERRTLDEFMENMFYLFGSLGVSSSHYFRDFKFVLNLIDLITLWIEK